MSGYFFVRNIFFAVVGSALLRALPKILRDFVARQGRFDSVAKGRQKFITPGEYYVSEHDAINVFR